jgi:hypothetical protein
MMLHSIEEEPTQGGQELRPGDSCQAWGKYDDLELSSKVIDTRVAASWRFNFGVALVVALSLLVVAFKHDDYCFPELAPLGIDLCRLSSHNAFDRQQE